MNIYTGEIKQWEDIPESQKSSYIEIQRDLTKVEALQASIKLYSPCGCGSGKKFKFCCKKP